MIPDGGSGIGYLCTPGPSPLPVSYSSLACADSTNSFVNGFQNFNAFKLDKYPTNLYLMARWSSFFLISWGIFTKAHEPNTWRCLIDNLPFSRISCCVPPSVLLFGVLLCKYAAVVAARLPNNFGKSNPNNKHHIINWTVRGHHSIIPACSWKYLTVFSKDIPCLVKKLSNSLFKYSPPPLFLQWASRPQLHIFWLHLHFCTCWIAVLPLWRSKIHLTLIGIIEPTQLIDIWMVHTNWQPQDAKHNPEPKTKIQ